MTFLSELANAALVLLIVCAAATRVSPDPVPEMQPRHIRPVPVCEAMQSFLKYPEWREACDGHPDQ